MYAREDWTLFRNPNSLGQKAGVSIGRIPQLVAKELVDNALDASGDCRAEQSGNGFVVEDEGEGIPGTDEEIAALVSVKRALTSSKIMRKPGRGALGNGLRVVAGAVLCSGGSIEVSTRGRTLELVPQDTGETVARRIGDWEGRGCKIVVRFGPKMVMPVDSLSWAHDAIKLARGESSYRGGSSPHWYDAEAFYELLQASGPRTARDVIAEMDGCTGARAGRIASEFKNRLASSLDRSEAERLLLAARASSKPVNPKRLGRCGPGMFPRSSYQQWKGLLPLGSTSGKIRPTFPVSIEVWAELGSLTRAKLFVNRTPVTGTLQAWKNKTDFYVRGCGLELGMPAGQKEVSLRINIDTPYMPITTDGKEPDAGPFERFVEELAAKAVRAARRRSPDSPASPDGKATKLTKKSVIIASIAAGAAKASGGERHRFGQRQLFYAIRPRFIEVFDEEPRWGTFQKIITAYENRHGDIPRMFRDPRGVIYHPHHGPEIPLGTLFVEKYSRPPWLFNKVLFIEKEGFFAALKDVKWPERHDCALMTSKGFSTRAARDLIDMLAETDEECEFFCIHDADAAGTMIYQTLVVATEARGARKVHVHNLGLEPAEGRVMRLQVERVQPSRQRRPVAEYVPDDDEEWLQRNRIELNAMTTPQFLEWLDRKFAPYAGKLVPPADVQGSRLESQMRANIKERITAEILEWADIDGRVDRAMERRAEKIAKAKENLDEMVRHDIEKNKSHPWTSSIDRAAERLSRRRARKQPGS